MSLCLINNPNQKKDGSGSFCYLKDGDLIICQAEEWAFGSCGTMVFHGLNAYIQWWTKENIDRLVAALPTLHLNSHYVAQEVYLQLSSGQIKWYFKELIEHPNVKQVDVYTNKAHGPHTLHLFRISAQKDFQ